MFEKLIRRLRLGKRIKDESEGFVLRPAAILHVDIVQSTQLVRRNPVLAHKLTHQLFCRLRHIGQRHLAIPREFRGDAAVIEFQKVSDAVAAAHAIHALQRAMNGSRLGNVNPEIRTGISYGEILGDSMITGEAVIRAQRLEQLSEPGQVLLDQIAVEQLDKPQQKNLLLHGTPVLKGFSEPLAVYRHCPHDDSRSANLTSYFRGLSCAA